MMAETCQELLDQLPDESLRKLAILKMAGYPNREIAEQMDVTLRTIQRKLDQIRNVWEGTQP
jgi:DNA-directed RNA polymerase specialized sigma24 family protein